MKPEQVADFMKDLPVRKIWGIGEKSERKLEELGVKTCGELQRFSRPELVNVFGKFGLELYDLCRGIDDRPVEPDRPRKSLSTEETFAVDLATLEQCEEKLEELFQDVMADLAQKESTREITKIFVKLKFNDFTRTTAERAGLAPTLEGFPLALRGSIRANWQTRAPDRRRRSFRRTDARKCADGFAVGKLSASPYKGCPFSCTCHVERSETSLIVSLRSGFLLRLGIDKHDFRTGKENQADRLRCAL